MELIKEIHIEGFRSLRDVRLSNLGHLNTVVGRNSSGKSNVLRAINLFFRGEVEPRKVLDFGRDVFDTVPKQKKKKKISVSISFQVPSQFRFRKGLEQVKALGAQFQITKSWDFDQAIRLNEEIIVTNEAGHAVNNPRSVAEAFLALINYRYIPNRSVPAEILKQESQLIASSIARKIKDTSATTALIDGLAQAASQVLEHSSQSLKKSNSPLSEPAIATTNNIGEMLSMQGFRATGAHGRWVQDQDWGAGHQSFFLYSLLHEIDTDYQNFFGWRQATIWAIEEPESALHRDLEIMLAGQLREWCLGKDSSFQVIQTTHSPTFCMAAEVGFLAEVDGKETVIAAHPIQKLVSLAENTGIAVWTPPILSSPWNPVVLCEGQTDADVLSHVANVCGMRRLRFTNLPTLDTEEAAGGLESVIKYIKSNQKLLANRLVDAPLIVLLDWEVSDQDLRRAQEAYGVNGDRYVIRPSQSAANSELSTDFAGIERFYPTKIWRDAHSAGECIIGEVQGQPITIASSQYTGRTKWKLAQRVRRIKDKDQLKHLEALIRTIETALS